MRIFIILCPQYRLSRSVLSFCGRQLLALHEILCIYIFSPSYALCERGRLTAADSPGWACNTKR